ncbi:MAG: glycoside hydrolase family 3 protein [Planctomycetes bacterium]|nr:glycoside hydrolase family 3 protein [Planctomycetota bacterium]
MQISERTQKIVASLTLRQQVGQLVVAPFTGKHEVGGRFEVERVKELVERVEVGGIIMFGGDVFETALVVNSLQRLSRVPLLVHSDLECGAGMQVRGATRFPNNMAVGAAGADEFAREMGRATAVQARALGIHYVLAPVLDVQTEAANPIVNTRAYGEDPALVARLGAAFIAGVAAGRGLATAKHFPGHGATTVDSHLKLPTAARALAEVEAVELAPFRAAVAAGVPAVMVGHILVTALDPELPTSLSHKVITGLLRERLGFDGVVMTDALMMGAIVEEYPEEEAVVLALKAGTDLLLYPQRVPEAVEAVLKAVEWGDLRAERVRASVERVVETKVALGLFEERLVQVAAAERPLFEAGHEELARRIAAAGLVLARDRRGLVPLTALAGRKLFCVSLEDELRSEGAVRFGEILGETVRTTQRFRVDDTTDAGALARLCAQIDADTVLVLPVFSRVRGFKGRAGVGPKLAESLAALGARTPATVLVSFGSPYLIRDLPEAAAYLCAWSDCDASVEAAARALLGGGPPPAGKLPVTVEGLQV